MLVQPCPRRAVRRPQNKIFRPPVLAKPPVNRGKQRIYPVTIECRGEASFVKQVAKRLAGRILILQKVGLVHHRQQPFILLLLVNPQIDEHGADIFRFLGDKRRRRIMNMEQQVRLNDLLQRALEGLDKLGRELADEADRIGQNDPASRRQGNGPHGRIKRGEQHVLAEHASPGQPVEER